MKSNHVKVDRIDQVRQKRSLDTDNIPTQHLKKKYA